MSPKNEEPKAGAAITRKFNTQVAELLLRMEPTEVVEVLSGAGSFIMASNQNQNQNGSSQLDS